MKNEVGFQDIWGLLGEYGFDIPVAVSLAEGQDYPKMLSVTYPRKRVADEEGNDWMVYSNRTRPDLRLFWAEGRATVRLLYRDETESKDVLLKVLTLEDFLDLEGRLKALIDSQN
jgi:hypothetical protein